LDDYSNFEIIRGETIPRPVNPASEHAWTGAGVTGQRQEANLLFGFKVHDLAAPFVHDDDERAAGPAVIVGQTPPIAMSITWIPVHSGVPRGLFAAR
jgi:hypothetical protein